MIKIELIVHQQPYTTKITHRVLNALINTKYLFLFWEFATSSPIAFRLQHCGYNNCGSK
jgi:hypothetical protein